MFPVCQMNNDGFARNTASMTSSTMGESNVAPKHRLVSRLESHVKDATEVNWLIHGSEFTKIINQNYEDRERIFEIRVFYCH